MPSVPLLAVGALMPVVAQMPAAAQIPAVAQMPAVPEMHSREWMESSEPTAVAWRATLSPFYMAMTLPSRFQHPDSIYRHMSSDDDSEDDPEA
jgi:hypothetical protein